MFNNKDNCKNIVNELSSLVDLLDEKQADELYKQIVSAKAIYLAAAGRSKLMLQAFGMRLMHIGFNVHVVGDVTTPAITDQDLLLIASGSGETASLVSMANKAKKVGTKLALVSTKNSSSIASLADCVVVIPTSTPKVEGSKPLSIQPGASLFEQTLLIYFDSFILTYMSDNNIDLSTVMVKHANLE